ncbi:GNAT family N-acetyltransferase [Nocardioides sp. JQ2195]|uniref:GNAT family N-acetyltransferase n=1 Tax=Nocardioides sp. JQ2195 TaxID=2592334 RepID=UPI00143E5657|nr:GNAT family N-acetyltransferase [Nocardioides sp. JQ2195]QIX25670.1 GNAT family N-acetyltransferase [Nocardioides sp. JQ2195]
MHTTNRRLARDDWHEALRLGIEGFGGDRSRSQPDVWPAKGQSCWGTFDGDRMVARLAGNSYHSWFDGVEVPTLGVCGVTVEAEQRGRGLLAPLFHELLAESDAPISTLYPTAPGIYRGFGYELVGTLRTIEVPTAHLTAVRPATGVTTRRATEADIPAIVACYTRWAADQNGPLTRTGPLFDHQEILTSSTGATVAVDADADDRVLGFLLWQRGNGYDQSSTITVDDLVPDTAEAARALWRVLGSFASVAGQVRVTTSGDDGIRLVLPTVAWREVGTHPYMLRILDVPQAFSLRRTSPAVRADLAFAVRGDRLGSTDGDYALRVADGGLTCTPGSASDRVYTPAGIALAYAGVQSSANLRRAGLLTGPTTDDVTWDLLLGGRSFHVRDHF